MRGRWFWRALRIIPVVIVGLALFGFLAMHLWNYLMPGLFGLHAITFWQAAGLIVLGRMLFGGFGPRFGGGPWRRHMAERWERMSPEEREKFREGMRGRCGGPRAPEPAATPEPNR
jgi:hypothetical protein